ncbi:MAG TPA: hypothetical protein VN493_02110 [Thermoanaerobaculia bacterium]|nr:hypothetical protein [Thermoanaerobaculia bacterium]
MSAQGSAIPSLPMPRRFVRYVLSFGISVGIGMAPFLGKIKVPGFEALLELFPRQLQGVLIPLSAFLMGLVALAIQFYHSEKIAAGSLRRYFRMGFIAMVLGFFLFVVLHRLFVIRVPLGRGESHAAVVVTPTRLETCGCERRLTNYDCVRTLSFDPAALATCWGGEAQQVRELSLMIPYLLLTSGFGALIGLLVLKEDTPAKRKQRRSRKPS